MTRTTATAAAVVNAAWVFSMLHVWGEIGRDVAGICSGVLTVAAVAVVIWKIATKRASSIRWRDIL